MIEKDNEGQLKNKKRIWKWIIIVSILIVLGGGYVYSIYHSLTTNLEETHIKIDHDDSEKPREKEVTFKNADPFSILLLGVDARPGDHGRSDTIIVLTINPHSKDTKMVSIPRDTYTSIIGHHTKDKINHAYAFGGIKMAMNSVENLLDIPIDYIVEINMKGFKDIVDVVGGIAVKNEFNFSYEGYHFPKGLITLDGKATLAYVRMRYEDPNGDFGRQNRQKQVISGILHKAVSVNSFINYKNIFQSLGNNVQTNLTLNEMIDLKKNYNDSIHKIDQIHFEKGKGKTINNIWYYITDSGELDEISETLRKHLELQ